MNLDTETEEGRANWARFRMLVLSKLYKSADVAMYVTASANELGIEGFGPDAARMTQTLRETSERFYNAVKPFLPT